MGQLSHLVGSAVSVDAYSSRLDALLGRFSALTQARQLGTPQAQCRTIGDADRRHRGDRPCHLFRDEPRVAAILARRPNATADLLQKQELAAMVHLCGAGSAKAFARRGFRLIAGKRCGDHDVATYLAEVNAMQREFLRFGAET
jgi:hypothetical protein